MTTPRKTALVVLYNHNYEKNIERIRKIYSGRFSQIRQLMPFYYGNEPDIIRVYGQSFYFHTYICQACEKLMDMDCDDFLIIGDDLLLNPKLNESNLHEEMNLGEGEFYMDGIVDVAGGSCHRGVLEAQNFATWYPGLDGSANRIMPSYEDAEKILRSRNALSSTSLTHISTYHLDRVSPFWKNLRRNAGHAKANLFQAIRAIHYRLFPRKMVYPCVFGYSDIIVVPKQHMRAMCDYLEVFATWRMFVELAIPTAIHLLPDVKITYADPDKYAPGNVWYPNTPEHYQAIDSIINNVLKAADYKIENLPKTFPEGYLYLHPVKLSGLS